MLAEYVVEIVAEECLGHQADLCHAVRHAGESVFPHVEIGTVVGSGVGTVVGNGVGTVVGGIGTAVGSEIGTVFGENSIVVGSGISALVGSGVGMVVRRRIIDMDRLRVRKTSEAKMGSVVINSGDVAVSFSSPVDVVVVVVVENLKQVVSSPQTPP